MVRKVVSLKIISCKEFEDPGGGWSAEVKMFGSYTGVFPVLEVGADLGVVAGDGRIWGRGRGTEERRRKKSMGCLTKANYDGKVKL